MNLPRIPHWIYYVALIAGLTFTSSKLAQYAEHQELPPNGLVLGHAFMVLFLLGLTIVDVTKLIVRKLKKGRPHDGDVSRPTHGPHSPGAYKRRFFDDWVVPVKILALLTGFALLVPQLALQLGATPWGGDLAKNPYVLRWTTYISILDLGLFLRWFYIAYRRLIDADIKTEATARRVAWEYLIPIVNLVYPYLRMKEIIKKSQHISAKEDATPVLLTWMGLFDLLSISGFYMVYERLSVGIKTQPAALYTEEFIAVRILGLLFMATTIYIIIYVNRLQRANPALKT